MAKAGRPEKRERNEKIFALISKGISYRIVARRYKKAVSTIHEIVQRQKAKVANAETSTIGK